MKKKLGLLPLALLTVLLPLIPSTAGAAETNPAQMSDTCYGLHPTIIKWTLDKATGKRLIQGTTGNDVIIGTDGNDIIHGNGGHDLICARGGNDDVTWDSQVGAVYDYVLVDLGGGNDRLSPASTDYNDPRDMIPVDAIGGPGDDFMEGAAGASDEFWAVNGEDTIDGEGGVGTDYNFDSCYFDKGNLGTASGCEYVAVTPAYPYHPQYVRAATTSTTNPPATPVTTTTRPAQAPVTTTTR